ncbi:MAG: DNA-binding protein HU [Calditrichaeota bacterium]|nr:DNA-binding protein HU [Calditrichota bacterium]
MNKADLVSRIAFGTGLTQVEVAAVVDGVLEGISNELLNGGHVEIRGFGTFKVEKRAERDAINPQTGQRIRVPAKLTPVFRPSEKLKAKLND